ncbi:MAG: hypothetical protein H6728_06905 [Myxococcales bacterium]|nr:hypothetical protein [Myxococcales bacterium]
MKSRTFYPFFFVFLGLFFVIHTTGCPSQSTQEGSKTETTAEQAQEKTNSETNQEATSPDGEKVAEASVEPSAEPSAETTAEKVAENTSDAGESSPEATPQESTPEAAPEIVAESSNTSCGFNKDCPANERCECDEQTGCFCKVGTRGTGKNGVDTCTSGNDCESALCIEGNEASFYCSDECTTDSDCGPNLPQCLSIQFVGTVCVRKQP